MMLAGAKTMQAAAKIYVPKEYAVFLLTQASINEKDRLTWQGMQYEVKDIERIDDGYVPSHSIAKLVTPFKPRDMSLKW
jgi:hypothetical protein